MKKSYRRVGFTISMLVHALAIAALAPLLGSRPGDEAEIPLPLTLAMFQAPQAPEIQELMPEETPVASPTQEQTPEASPEEQKQRTPIEKPALPPQTAPLPEPEAESKSEPKPKHEPAPEPSTAPEPPKPVKKATPKPPAAAPMASGHTAPAARTRPALIEDESARRDYLAALARQIHRKKYYPKAARLNRQEGRVVVTFVIQGSGLITDIRVTRSSGSATLDKAAVQTLERISPFHAIPGELSMDRWEIAVPIEYSLRG